LRVVSVERRRAIPISTPVGLYLAVDSRLFSSEAAMERVRIRRRRSMRRADEVVDVVPTQPVVTTDDAAELITRIDQLLDE
jgi:hypothetical protein